MDVLQLLCIWNPTFLSFHFVAHVYGILWHYLQSITYRCQNAVAHFLCIRVLRDSILLVN